MKKVYRFLFYLLGMFLLALGIMLNTKTKLGVSPIISVPYSISTVFHLDFGNTTLAVYILFIIIQFVLKGKNAKAYDALQIVVAIVFTRILNAIAVVITIEFHAFWQNFLMLLVAIALTGIGAAMTVDMRLIPNPGDGIVQAIADKIHKELGFTKNCFDLLNITITTVVGLTLAHKLIGIGIGTVVAVIGVGRVVAIFNQLFRKKLIDTCGIKC